MQPYQTASKEIQRQGEAPHRLLSKGVALASAGSAGLALNRVMPFLSKYIPQDIAIKGLSKIDPRFEKFITGAMSAGHAWDEISDFIKEKAGGKEAEGQKAPDQRSIIEQYSPELFGVLNQLIQQGKTPLEAGSLVQMDEHFKKDIQKMEKDHKTPWTSILEATFGSAKQPMQQQQQAQPQAQSQQQQPGAGQQALMQSMDKLQQILSMRKR